ncbi:hypothetical protein [Labilibaculum euxinus]|uniref:Uncharacterized protein n=1 Tax=Labilibaculum euxinus TaxID=2686357 RepID=A0A7M4DB81_9BACT|nr:hypothetical protein [Labilibaculum euxinus]MUP39910.1 hypothetical protein [Labilibaculum euxinus]MVB09115.1 hypothetical protein [Labilibaculum euxinus]
MSCPYGFREPIICVGLLYCAWQGHRHGVSVLIICCMWPLIIPCDSRKLLKSSNKHFIEFENQEHLKIKGRDMSCPYGFREPIICVDLCCIVHGRDIAMACPFK